MNLFKAKFALYYHLRLQPSEIENMPFYEFEYTLENLKDFLKEKNEAEKGQSDQMNKNMPDMSKFKAPKMPSTPKMPNIKMPRLG